MAGPHRSAALPREDASASLFFSTSAVLTILVVAAGLVSLLLVIVPTGLATLLNLLFLLAGFSFGLRSGWPPCWLFCPMWVILFPNCLGGRLGSDAP